MARKKKKASKWKAAYMKERRRIQRFSSANKAKGIQITYKLPEIPKRITEASVRRLQKITPEVLHRNENYVNLETGEIISREAWEVQRDIRKQIEKQRKAQKEEITKEKSKQPPQQTDLVLRNLLEQPIAEWQPLPHWSPGLVEAKRQDRNTVKNIVEGAINKLGREQVARNAEEHAFEISGLLAEILYGSGGIEGNFADGRTKVNADIARFNAILLGRALTVEEAIFAQEIADAYDYW